MSDGLSTEATIVPVWNMTINKHKITKELIFHSDRGSQYASYRFTNMIKKHNELIKQSMGRKGNCWDNAVTESFFKSLKVQWIYKYGYDQKHQVELSVFTWIGTWYNKRRSHSYLGYKTINEFNLQMYNKNVAA